LTEFQPLNCDNAENPYLLTVGYHHGIQSALGLGFAGLVFYIPSFFFFGVRSNFNKLKTPDHERSAWITKKHSASASAMAPHGRGATPVHQYWWSTLNW